MIVRNMLEITSFIATTIGLPIASIGVGILIWQTRAQQRQTRREALAKLYAEQDTHEARLARHLIYNAEPERLRLKRVNEARQVPGLAVNRDDDGNLRVRRGGAAHGRASAGAGTRGTYRLNEACRGERRRTGPATPQSLADLSGVTVEAAFCFW